MSAAPTSRDAHDRPMPMPMPMPGPGRGRGPGPQSSASERGAATALVLGMLALCLGAVVAVLLFSSASLGQTRANVAADLAVLAASDAARGVSDGDPCGLAAQVAQRNGTRLESCWAPAGASGPGSASASVTISAAVTPGLDWLPLPRATAEAWAGAPP